MFRVSPGMPDPHIMGVQKLIDPEAGLNSREPLQFRRGEPIAPRQITAAEACSQVVGSSNDQVS
jgi:hypothetical protein